VARSHHVPTHSPSLPNMLKLESLFKKKLTWGKGRARGLLGRVGFSHGSEYSREQVELRRDGGQEIGGKEDTSKKGGRKNVHEPFDDLQCLLRFCPSAPLLNAALEGEGFLIEREGKRENLKMGGGEGGRYWLNESR